MIARPPARAWPLAPLYLIAACSSGGGATPDARVTDGVAADAPPADSASDGSVQDASCAMPSYEDDIVLDDGKAVALPGRATAAAALGHHVLACGEGFFSVVAPSAAKLVAKLEDKRLAGTCGGLATNGSDRALAVTHRGQVLLVKVELGASPALTVLGSAHRPGTKLFDVTLAGETAWVSAGGEGLLAYSLAGDSLTASSVAAGARDARSALVVGDRLLVADGAVAEGGSDAGGEVRLLSADGNNQLHALGGLDGVAARLLEAGPGRAVLLRRGGGVDVVRVASDTLAVDYSFDVRAGLPLEGALVGDALVLATGSHLLRYRLGESGATLLSGERRPTWGDLSGPWFRAVVATPGGPAALTDDALVGVTLGAGAPAPEIELEQHTFSLDPSNREALFRVHNRGRAELVIDGFDVAAPFSAEPSPDYATPRPGCPGHWLVAPGGVLLAWQRHDGSPGFVARTMTISSNDPDQPQLAFPLEHDRSLAKIDDAVDDFDLVTVDGGRFQLAAHGKRVVLAKLYNPT